MEKDWFITGQISKDWLVNFKARRFEKSQSEWVERNWELVLEFLYYMEMLQERNTLEINEWRNK